MSDRRGITELSFQYLIAIYVAGIAIALIGFAGYSMWKDYQMNEAIKEINRVISEVKKMYVSSDGVSNKKIKLNLPYGVDKVVFGSSNPDMKNHYYILMRWGEKRSFYAKNFYFTGENGDVAILYKNTHEIVIELMEKEGDKYVKIIPVGR